MILCLDSGNTRLKWGLHDGAGWREQGALPRRDFAPLAELPRRHKPPEKILLANVAGPGAAADIAAALAAWPVAVTTVTVEKYRLGVTNGYAQPGQLGVDRWCALIGARALTTAPCLVVGAGTATTIDSLDETGRFLGGFILPGTDLMRAALAGGTAGLPHGKGRYAPYPTCTADAILSGCLAAQAGAVERAFAMLNGKGDARCILFGGAAPPLAALLAIPSLRVDNLPLEGLLRLAQS